MSAPPRWLLAVPDAIRQLEALDRDLLTRRDVERLFGVSRARAAQLMRTFGAERVGASRVLRRTALLRQLRQYRQRAAFRGEATRRARVVTAIRQARLIGIRAAVPREAREARLVVCHRDEVTHSLEIAYNFICNRFPSSHPSFAIMMSEGVEDPLWTA